TLVWTNTGLAPSGETIHVVGFQPDGRTLVAAAGGSAEQTVFVLDRMTGELGRAFTVPRGSTVLSPDGKALLVACGAIRSWDLDTGRERPRLGQHDGGSSQCCFSRDGRRLTTDGPNGTALIWEWPSGRLVKQ